MKPSSDDLFLAAQWLDVYEGDGLAEVQRVRAWLLAQADALEFRAACRAAGVSVGDARKALRDRGLVLDGGA